MGRIRIYRKLPPGEVLDMLDRRALFERRWGYGALGQRRRLELESALVGMWRDLSAPGNWSAGAIWGVYGTEPRAGYIQLTAVKPDVRLSVDFGRMMATAPAPKKIVLQAVTLGAKANRLVKKERGAAERLLWHGLAAEATEALAEWCSRKAAGELGWDRWRRISPGFPSWPELAEQRKLFRMLRPSSIGIRLKRSLVMDPEYSTSAMVYPQ